MAERTERGEDEQRQRDEQMQGEPLPHEGKDHTQTEAGKITRDKGVRPAHDERRDGHGVEK